MIYRLWQAPGGGGGIDRLQLLVPHTLRLEVLRWVHGAAGAGYFGNSKSARWQRFYWPGVGRMLTAAMSAWHRKDPADAHAVAAVPNRGAHGEDRDGHLGSVSRHRGPQPFCLGRYGLL